MPSDRPLRAYRVAVLDAANRQVIEIVHVEAPTIERAADEVAADYLTAGNVTAQDAETGQTFVYRRGAA